jgi:hypothetical protein
MRGISLLAEELLAFQEGLYSMELDIVMPKIMYNNLIITIPRFVK